MLTKYKLPIDCNIFLVVLFNLLPSESTTVQSILSYFDAQCIQGELKYHLVIWDNSPISAMTDVQQFIDKAEFIDILYVNTPENLSLSCVYNYVVSTMSKDKYLTLFDQDTVMDHSYFKELLKLHLGRWPLILPKVECGGVLVSPGKRFISRGILLKKIDSGAISSKNLLAINSGMSIARTVFDSFMYDEKLLFYGTDTYFMRNYEKYYDYAFILSVPISHSLAIMQHNTIEWRSTYYCELVRAANIIFRNSVLEKIFTFLYTGYYKLRIKLGCL